MNTQSFKKLTAKTSGISPDIKMYMRNRIKGDRTTSTLSSTTLPTCCSEDCGSPERYIQQSAPISDKAREIRI